MSGSGDKVFSVQFGDMELAADFAIAEYLSPVWTLRGIADMNPLSILINKLVKWDIQFEDFLDRVVDCPAVRQEITSFTDHVLRCLS